MCWYCDLIDLCQVEAPSLAQLKAFKEALRGVLVEELVNVLADNTISGHPMKGWHVDMIAGIVLERTIEYQYVDPYPEPTVEARNDFKLFISACTDSHIRDIITSPTKGPRWKWCEAVAENRRRKGLCRLTQSISIPYVDF